VYCVTFNEFFVATLLLRQRQNINLHSGNLLLAPPPFQIPLLIFRAFSPQDTFRRGATDLCTSLRIFTLHVYHNSPLVQNRMMLSLLLNPANTSDVDCSYFTVQFISWLFELHHHLNKAFHFKDNRFKWTLNMSTITSLMVMMKIMITYFIRKYFLWQITETKKNGGRACKLCPHIHSSVFSVWNK
jgi:hypothetical protein